MTVEGTTRPRIRELLAVLARWDPAFAGFPARLEILTDERIDEIVRSVPEEADEMERCEFIRRLLRHRRDLLKEEMA